MFLVTKREATGASPRSLVCAAGPGSRPVLAVSKLAFGSDNEPASLRDRPGHDSGLFRRLRASSLGDAPIASPMSRDTVVIERQEHADA